MSSYIPYTDEQREQAHKTDLVSLLRSQGEHLKRSGREYEWRDGSAKVTVRGNLWYHQYERTGGDTVGFVQRFYNKNYPEALEYLLGGACGTLTVSAPVTREAKPFELPTPNGNMRRVYAYLINRRGIDQSVLSAFVQRKMIFESADYHNAVFVGYDMDGIPRHAHKRGTGSESTYKGNAESSMPEYSFHWHGTSETLYLFEAPIDMLSFITMYPSGWRSHSYAAACSVSDRVLFQMLKDNPNIKTACLCMDNDEAGRKANQRIMEKLLAQGIPYKILVPTHKDWNEVLLNPPTETEEIQWTQSM